MNSKAVLQAIEVNIAKLLTHPSIIFKILPSVLMSVNLSILHSRQLLLLIIPPMNRIILEEFSRVQSISKSSVVHHLHNLSKSSVKLSPTLSKYCKSFNSSLCLTFIISSWDYLQKFFYAFKWTENNLDIQYYHLWLEWLAQGFHFIILWFFCLFA